jgi:uncharacterized secreted protein with C-terminal beta-propeller domain
MSDRFDDRFEGLDRPRRLSPDLRTRLEAAIAAQAGPLQGIDGPRPLRESARVRIARSLSAPHAGRRIRRARAMLGAAVLLVIAIAIASVTVAYTARPSRQTGSARPPTERPTPSLTAVAPLGDGSVGPLDISDAVPIRLAFAESCDQLLDYLKTNGAAHVTAFGLPGGRGPTFAGRVISGGRSFDPASGGGADGAALSPYANAGQSTTNNQEAGVEEPDIVQQDGSTIFVLRYNAIEVVDVTSGQPNVLTAVPVPPGTQSMFLDGDRLVLLTAFDYGYSVAETTLVTILDVSVPSTPVVGGSLTLDGGLVSARMVDGHAHVVVSRSPSGLPFVLPTDGSPEAQAGALAYNRGIVAASTIKQWIGERECGSVAHPQTFSGFDITTVYTFDAAAPDASTSASVVAGGETVYASPTSLYIATMDWGAWQQQTGEQATPPRPPKVVTQVHLFDIAGDGPATYVASGRVGGYILSQYSLSELDGDLRIATTDRPAELGEGQSSSAVTILRPDGGVLVPIGAVGGLGGGETIQGVRFVGDLGFVVTFLRKDPLYVIDVRSPTAPIVRGVLEVSGYSAYLHPIEAGFVVGVGWEANDDGITTGVQVSVFDVRDLDQPSLVGRVVVPNAYSSVEFDPHAFLYWPSLALTVVPLENEGSALVVRTDAAGAVEVGRVHHPEGGPITRSLVVGRTLYTVSENGVLATALDGLVEGTWAPFAG